MGGVRAPRRRGDTGGQAKGAGRQGPFPDRVLLYQLIPTTPRLPRPNHSRRDRVSVLLPPPPPPPQVHQPLVPAQLPGGALDPAGRRAAVRACVRACVRVREPRRGGCACVRAHDCVRVGGCVRPCSALLQRRAVRGKSEGGESVCNVGRAQTRAHTHTRTRTRVHTHSTHARARAHTHTHTASPSSRLAGSPRGRRSPSTTGCRPLATR